MPAPTASPASHDPPTPKYDEYDPRATANQIGLAIMAFFIIAAAMVIAVAVCGGWGRICRKLRKRRERRRGRGDGRRGEGRRAGGDEESAIEIGVAVRSEESGAGRAESREGNGRLSGETIEVAVRNELNGVGREVEGRLSGETVVVHANRA